MPGSFSNCKIFTFDHVANLLAADISFLPSLCPSGRYPRGREAAGVGTPMSESLGAHCTGTGDLFGLVKKPLVKFVSPQW